MNEEIINALIAEMESLEPSINKLLMHYPKITEKLIPLSKTGISPRIYHDWKAKGLVESKDENEKSWIKLDLIDYMWLMVLKTYRQYGISIKDLLQLKKTIYSSESFKTLINDPEFEFFIEKSNSFDKEQKLKIKYFLKAFKIFFDNASDIAEKFFTIFSSSILNLLISNYQSYLICYPDESGVGLHFNCIPLKSLEKFPNLIFQTFNKTNLSIPLKQIVLDIINTPELEKYSIGLGLINSQEQRVIETIQKGDFTELVIKFDDKKRSNLVIVHIKDKNILQDKAKEIRRILGMNEYKEVIIKSRNEKDLYIRNKKIIK